MQWLEAKGHRLAVCFLRDSGIDCDRAIAYRNALEYRSDQLLTLPHNNCICTRLNEPSPRPHRLSWKSVFG